MRRTPFSPFFWASRCEFFLFFVFFWFVCWGMLGGFVSDRMIEKGRSKMKLLDRK